MKEEIQQFICVYMYELERYLATQKDEIRKMPLWLDEANTDRPLKEYLKHLIENSFDSIPQNSGIGGLITDDGTTVDVFSLLSIRISRVLLPENITDEIKDIIRTGKDNIYTNPDICFEINFKGNLYYETVELKTTKDNVIPGSSIQQVTPNEWVIFVKFSKTNVEIATGQYINAINSSMQFPDRSPRPQVSFKELSQWNKANRIVNDSILELKPDLNSVLKYELLSDWQNVLSKRWVDILINATSTKKNEPWFNNALRKFVLDFLDKYDELPFEEKIALKNKIKSLIE